MSLRVAFRVDASSSIGTGHLKRCLSLANQLADESALCLFVCREIPETLETEVKARGHGLRRLRGEAKSNRIGHLEHSAWLGVDWFEDAEQTLQSLSAKKWDWIIVDHYAIDSHWQSAIRQSARHVLVIDDLADRTHECDLLLDQNLVADMNARYTGKVSPDCRLLLGPRYALLDASFAHFHNRVEPRVGVKKILIYFGGVDNDNLTLRTLKIVLSEFSSNIVVDVVLPNALKLCSETEELAAWHDNVNCFRNLPTLAPLIASADLAIGAMGSTTWERLCLGLPTIAATTAANQLPVAMELSKLGAVIWLGDSGTVTDHDIKTSIQDVFEDQSLTAWSRRCRQLCDGNGARRVVEQML